MKIKRFRLIVDGKLTLALTKKNYKDVLGMQYGLLDAVEYVLDDMEKTPCDGMGISMNGYYVQVNKLQ